MELQCEIPMYDWCDSVRRVQRCLAPFLKYGKQSMCRFAMLTLVVTCLLSSGCVAMRGQPQRSGDITVELTQLEPYFKSDVITKYNNDFTDDEKGKRDYRNEVILGRVRAFDLHFGVFEREIVGESASMSLAVDVAAIGLNAAGTLVPSASTKAILAAISGGLIGAKAKVDEHVFYEKTMPVLLGQMAAARKARLTVIYEGLGKDTTQYPLLLGLIDLEEYFKAGTIMGSLQDIAIASGAKADEAQQKLEVVRGMQFVSDAAQEAADNLLDLMEGLPAGEAYNLLKSPPTEYNSFTKGIILGGLGGKTIEDAADILSGPANDAKAKALLKSVLVSMARLPDKLAKWKTAIQDKLN